MAKGRSHTRNGRAGVWQISDTRFASARKITGSPCYIVQECYQADESPTGWYTLGEPQYLEGPDEMNAVQAFVETLKA